MMRPTALRATRLPSTYLHLGHLASFSYRVDLACGSSPTPGFEALRWNAYISLFSSSFFLITLFKQVNSHYITCSS